MNKNICVSVIVPVYNAEKYLRRCLDSLIIQTLTNIEIVVIDDGSDDSSRMIVEEYVSSDRRVKLISKNRQGCAVARNEGIAVSQGMYIAYVDADDYVEPDAFEQLIQCARNNSYPDMVFGNYCMEYPNRTERQISYLPENRLILQDELVDIALKKRFFAVVNFLWKGLYKSDFIRKNNITHFNIYYGSDTVYNMNCILCANSAAFVDKVIYHYVQTPNSIQRKVYKMDLPYWLNEQYLIRQSLLKQYGKQKYAKYIDEYSMRHHIVMVISNEVTHKCSFMEKRRLFREMSQQEFVSHTLSNVKAGVINNRIKYCAILLKHKCFFMLALLSVFRSVIKEKGRCE